MKPEDWKTWNKTTKTKWITLAKEHQEQDRFIQGKWLQNNSDTDGMHRGCFFQGKWLQNNSDTDGMHRGCFFGCMMQTDDNVLQKATEQMKNPAWIIHVAEKIFEGLPKEEAVLFPLQLLEVIPLNKNMYQIWKDWHYTVLMDKDHGQINYCRDNKKCTKAVKQCADLFKTKGEISESAAESAYSAARSAARSAAYSAAESAYSAAESARSAYSASESASESAAWSAAWSAYSAARSARSAARSAHYQWMRDTLISLLTKS